MGIERLPKYFSLSGLIWKLLRPIAAAVAASTKNTTMDDELVKGVDEIFKTDLSEFDDVA